MRNNRSQRRTTSDEVNLPHQQYDFVTRDLFYIFPEDMLRLVLKGKNYTFVEHVDSELVSVEARTMDILLKVSLDGKDVLIHCEIQTDDSVHPNMVRRNVGYIGRCYERYGLPIYSFVIYLKENAGKSDPGGYIQDVQGHRLIVEYKVIRLSQIDGEAILETKQPGLMPFTPLMRPPKGMSALEWTTRCIEETKTLDVDVQLRNNLLVEQWVLSGLRHERQSLIDSLSEDILNNSTIYDLIIERGIERGRQEGIEEGKQLGAKESTIENILGLLDRRFEMDTAPVLTPLLEPIGDLQQLRQLFYEALDVVHLEDFIRTLMERNGSQ